jgi:hypothetical protein
MRTRGVVYLLVIAILGAPSLGVAWAQLPPEVLKQMWSAQVLEFWGAYPAGPDQ